jgi:hypothetical protein
VGTPLKMQESEHEVFQMNSTEEHSTN